MNYPIIDLHSDLLSYLDFKPHRSHEDALSRNSYAQMQEGHVKVQTFAIFSTTSPASVDQGKRQIQLFLDLLENYPTQFSLASKNLSLQNTNLIPAIENASAFASETEPLSDVFDRLEDILNRLKTLFYITTTWETENRFGGGNASTVGLKPDGEVLLEWLSNKRIAVDMSHTSDRYAHEVIEYIDKKNLDIPLIASHSNFRAISDVQRNLPDAIAREIIRRKGLIGLTFFAPFIDANDPMRLIRHVEYGLSLGAENALCFGSDFFCDSDFPILAKKYGLSRFFFEEYKNSSCYPHILELLEKKLHLSSETLHAIAHGNALRFLNKAILAY